MKRFGKKAFLRELFILFLLLMFIVGLFYYPATMWAIFLRLAKWTVAFAGNFWHWLASVSGG